MSKEKIFASTIRTHPNSNQKLPCKYVKVTLHLYNIHHETHTQCAFKVPQLFAIIEDIHVHNVHLKYPNSLQLSKILSTQCTFKVPQLFAIINNQWQEF